MAKVTSMLDEALAYAREGLPVIPLHSITDAGACTCGNTKCKAAGKHPRVPKGLKQATTDEDQIKKWWSPRRWPNANIGGVGGEFMCLDIDAKSGGHESLRELISSNAPLPDTACAETGEYDGERGMHYWFKSPPDKRCASRANIRPGIDIRCVNGYAVMPPSRHLSGVQYEWIDADHSFAAYVEAPEWVPDLVPEAVDAAESWAPNPDFKMSKEVRDFLRGSLEVEPGEQRAFLVRAARSVLTTGKDVETAAALLFEGYDGEGGISACPQEVDPWEEEEVLYLVEDIYAKGPTTGLDKDFSGPGSDVYSTDLGNAHRLVKSFDEGHVFHILAWGVWYIWDSDNGRFIEDDGHLLRRRFAEVTKKMIEEASSAQDDDTGRKLFSHALRSQGKPRIEAAVSIAGDYVSVPISELNSDPYLLNVNNGVVDLRSGDLLEPDPSLLLTKRARADYNPKAKSKVWTEFLKSVVPNKDLRDFLQKAFGYTLTGATDEHKFFYLYGPPASGKSTLLEAFAFLMGNYSESADVQTFMRNPNATSNQPSEDLARLANARMVVTHEVEEGMRFAEGHISKLTGGDSVPARFLHQKTFVFHPKFKLWFSANHKPRVTGSARSGIWRRILVIPMNETVPEDERDPTLARRLRSTEVQSAILAWAVEGCMEWIKDNESGHLMAVPTIVSDEVDEYKREADHVNGFVDEMIVVVDDGSPRSASNAARVPKQALYEAYRAWCEREGRRNVLTSNMLTRRLTDLGLTWKQAQFEGKRPDCWIGIQVKSAGVKIKGKTSKQRKEETT